jgi:hypothetical protein
LFGCCFAVRRALALATGFDERRPGYALGEDLDVFRRFRASHQTGGRPSLRFSSRLHAYHRQDGHDRTQAWQRGLAKGAFLRWWASRHGAGNPATPMHLTLAALAAASGRGHEPASFLGVWCGLCSRMPILSGRSDKKPSIVSPS